MLEKTYSQTEKLIVKRKNSKDENENDEQYIFYGQKKKFTNKIELDVTLNFNHAFRVLILIDYKSTVNFLSVKIADYMEHFPIFSNLEGLKAINVTKKTEKGNIQIPVETPGLEIKDYLDNGNILYCDLKTDEYWIKTSLHMYSNQKKLSISLDIKNRLEMTLKKLKLLLIKTGLNFWIDFCKNKKDYFHYIYVDSKCKTLKSKQTLEFEIEDLSKSDKIDESNMLVGDVFDFDSEIICELKLISIEELIFMELNKLKTQEFSNKFKFEDLQQVSFEEFISSRKFEEEMRTIQKLIKKSLKNPVCDLQGKIYCYNKATLAAAGDASSVNTDGIISSSIIIMPTRLKKTKNLNCVVEEVNEIGLDDSRASLRDRSFTLNQRKTFNTFIDENSKLLNELKGKSDVQEYLIKIESADDTKIVDTFKRNTRKTKTTEADKIVLERPRFTNSHSMDKLPDNNERIILNIETGNNSQINNNFIPTNTHNTNIVIEEGREENKEQLMKALKGSKIITHTKACDKDEGFPVLGTEINQPVKKHKKKKSDNFQKLRIVSNKSLTLCNDILGLITLDKFNTIIDSYAKIKICKIALEKITMPQFRNVKMNDENKEESLNKNIQEEDFANLPVVNNNRTIFIFVLFLILIFAILVIFILLH